MTDYTALATEALTYENVEVYFGEITDDQIDNLGGTAALVEILADVLASLGVTTHEDSTWTAPWGVIHEARLVVSNRLR